MVKFVRFIQNPANKCTQFMTHIMVVFLHVVSGCKDETVRIWSITKDVQQMVKEHKNAVSYVSVCLKTIYVIKSLRICFCNVAKPLLAFF